MNFENPLIAVTPSVLKMKSHPPIGTMPATNSRAIVESGMR